MDGSNGRRSMPFGPLLMVAGAVLVVLGCLLPWFQLKADLSRFGGAASVARSVGGLDTSDGPLFLAVAVAMGLLGVVALVVPSSGTRRGVSLAAVLGAVFVGGFAIYDALTPTSQAIDEMSGEVGAGGFARRLIEGLFERGFITIGTAFGLWLVVVGAAVVLLGSVLALLQTSAPETAAAAPAAPMPSAAGSSAPVPPAAAPPAPAPADDIPEDREPPPGA